MDWFYPPRCALCDTLLGKQERYLCKNCRNKLPSPIEEPYCKHCGKPLDGAGANIREYCLDCETGLHIYEEGRGLFLYEGALKQSLLRLKFSGRKEYGAFLGKLMCVYGASYIHRIQPEILIPVPMHRSRQNRRGYNQAELLARVLGNTFHIPVRTDLVQKRKSTKAQKELNRKARRKNLSQAFTVSSQAGRYRRVMIIDDVYTTGSTIEAVAGNLKAKGVKKVYFLSLCIGRGI